ncbi:MarR family winged helix-turn-helix transcriptional regulator [Acuticoccus mangrovi]|uniref:Winged helix-turn-helix transcriptional regulator n=1 Tax=Acuticoccus mangrovi TaxID=2796142 RepID=A0A934MBI6_9HYPH|nr:MarR family winged helix-turn-helix transcriptional regulator [Acuticoccus mangrovi]MBJ3774162.1 winged helix-turn-helix transcriptional regulator [Acuticoccus mangrovi]
MSQSANFELDAFLPYQLAILSSRVSAEFAEIYGRRFGLSLAEWRVVAHLSAADKVSTREVFARVDLDKAKISRAAQRLEANGLIEKRQSAVDRRLVEMSLTQKGRDMMAEIAPIARRFEADFLARFADGDGRAFQRLVMEALEASK